MANSIGSVLKINESNKDYSLKGDGIFVYNENKPHCDIMRIDRLWKTRRFDLICELN